MFPRTVRHPRVRDRDKSQGVMRMCFPHADTPKTTVSGARHESQRLPYPGLAADPKLSYPEHASTTKNYHIQGIPRCPKTIISGDYRGSKTTISGACFDNQKLPYPRHTTMPKTTISGVYRGEPKNYHIRSMPRRPKITISKAYHDAQNFHIRGLPRVQNHHIRAEQTRTRDTNKNA